MALLGHWRVAYGKLISDHHDPALHKFLVPAGDLPSDWESEQGQRKESPVAKLLQRLWNEESGQDIAEYAVMLAVILVIVVGTIRLIGSNANNVFSNVGSAIQ